MSTEYTVVVTVDGNPVGYDQYLENLQQEEDGSVSTFVRGSGIPPEFFEDEDELYSRELYVTGDHVDVDDEDEGRLPSQTVPARWFDSVEDYDGNVNFRECVPVVDETDKTITFSF